MKIDLLILQLAVIFLPGIIWARLDASYAAKVKPTEGEFFLRAFLFGITIYAVEFLVFAALGWPFKMADLADAATKEIVGQDVLHEVLWALGIGLVLSVLWLYFTRYKLLTRFLQWIRATKKYGDEDVWDFTFNSKEVAVEYVHFRDFDNQCVYAGWVNTFSETDKLRELVLLDVIVYDFEGTELYTIPRLYLARSPEKIHIEFPYGQSNEPRTHSDDHGPPGSNGRLQQGEAPD
jgi:Family of unknown function (DUF6338)